MCNINPVLLENNGYPPCIGDATAPSGIVCPYPCTFGEAPRDCVLTDWGPWTDLQGNPNACFCNDPNAEVIRFTDGTKSTNCLIWAQERRRTIQVPARNGGTCNLSESNVRQTRPCPDNLLPNLPNIQAQGVALASATCPPRSPSAAANCGQPPMLQSGAIGRVASCDFPGGFVTYECDPGFTLVGSSFVWCEGTGKWSQPLPQCVPDSSGAVSASDTRSLGQERGSVTAASETASLQSLRAYLINLYYMRYGTTNLPSPALATTRSSSSSASAQPASLDSELRTLLSGESYDEVRQGLLNGDWDKLAKGLADANMTTSSSGGSLK